MEKQSQQLRAGKIVRGEDPLNLEMPFETLRDFITPTESFYVRTHFPIPKIDKKDWRLRIQGEDENPLDLRDDDLLKLEVRTTPVTLDAAETNGTFLDRKV